MNKLKTKLDDLDVGKLKTFPEDLKELNNVVDNEVVKNAEFKTLSTKVNNFDKKIPDVTTLIHINQHNIDKQNLEKKNDNIDKKIPDASGLVTTTVFNSKISEVENKIPDTSSLVTKTVINTRISEVENKIADYAKYFTNQEFNKLIKETFSARLKQTYLRSKTEFDNKLTSFNRKKYFK